MHDRRSPALIPPPFDPELAAALTLLRMPAEPSIQEIRRIVASEWLPDDAALTRNGALTVRELFAPHPGLEPGVPLLVCRPDGATAPTPAVYFIHGGGMVAGHHRMVGADVLLDWTVDLGLIVVSVGYRLAPEHPHPVPVEDCYAGLAWIVAHAGELGVDPSRVLVAGGRAGGGLAAAVALLARDRGGPPLLGQLLSCPMVDDRGDTPSVAQMAGRDVFDRASHELGWTALLGDRRGGPDVPPYAAPARATDLSGLPPAFIEVGSAETLRDEAVAYAARIWRSGGQAALSQDARATRLRWLHRCLAP